MPHNDSNELVLDAQTERELRTKAAQALGKKRRLSYFQRQEAHDLGLGKALDVHGNLDLNEASNEMHQSVPSTRVSPNIKTASTYLKSDTPEGRSSTHPHQKMHSAEDLAKAAMTNKSMCHRHCQKNTGRSLCPHCYGQGYEKGDAMHGGTRSRNLTGG